MQKWAEEEEKKKVLVATCDCLAIYCSHYKKPARSGASAAFYPSRPRDAIKKRRKEAQKAIARSLCRSVDPPTQRRRDAKFVTWRAKALLGDCATFFFSKVRTASIKMFLREGQKTDRRTDGNGTAFALQVFLFRLFLLPPSFVCPLVSFLSRWQRKEKSFFYSQSGKKVNKAEDRFGSRLFVHLGMSSHKI